MSAVMESPERVSSARGMEFLARSVGVAFGIGTQLLFLFTVVYLFLFLDKRFEHR